MWPRQWRNTFEREEIKNFQNGKPRITDCANRPLSRTKPTFGLRTKVKFPGSRFRDSLTSCITTLNYPYSHRSYNFTVQGNVLLLTFTTSLNLSRSHPFRTSEVEAGNRQIHYSTLARVHSRAAGSTRTGWSCNHDQVPSGVPEILWLGKYKYQRLYPLAAMTALQRAVGSTVYRPDSGCTI